MHCPLGCPKVDKEITIARNSSKIERYLVNNCNVGFEAAISHWSKANTGHAKNQKDSIATNNTHEGSNIFLLESDAAYKELESDYPNDREEMELYNHVWDVQNPEQVFYSFLFNEEGDLL